MKIAMRWLSSYRSVQCVGFDRPLVIETVPHCSPVKDQIKIKIFATGINFADLLQCKGGYVGCAELNGCVNDE